jgi:hypothetical protein
MSERELQKFMRTEKMTCIRSGCDRHVTQIAMCAGWYKECDCGATWDYTDPRGKEITKEQYEERAARMARRLNVTQRGGHSLGKDSMMPAKKKSKKSKKAAKAKKTGTTIGKVATDYLVAHRDASPDDVIAAVKKQFPESGITPSCVSWYKNKARKDGLLPAAAGKKSGAKKAKKSGAKRLKK